MINVTHLTKRFGDHTAVDDVTFTVSPGTVAGFIGPNGAGKSTTLRAIVGLTPPTAGTTTVLGRPYRELDNPAARVGTLLDASAVHPGRTGRETLHLTAMAIGASRERVDEVLALVQLSASEARQRVGTYSLGMRQRLGVANALLGRPEVLILDEPATGLDPQGIRWMRELLRHTADAGASVLLSSHLQHAVGLIADQLIVIGRGRILAEGAASDLLAQGDLESLFFAATADTSRERLAS